MAKEKIRGNNAPTLTEARREKLDQIIDLYRGGSDEYRNNWIACFRMVYPRYKSEQAIRRAAHNARHHEYTLKRLAEFTEASAERADFNQDRVLREIAAIAFFDPRKLYDEEGRPKNITDLDAITAAAVAGIKTVKIGDDANVIEYKINDKNNALEKLMRHLGLYQQDNEQKNTSLAEALEAGIKRARELSE